MKFKELLDHSRFPFGIVGKVQVMQEAESRDGFVYEDYDGVADAIAVHGEENLMQLFAFQDRIVFVIPRAR